MLDTARPVPPPFRVMFYVQHLLGIGHLVRAARIAKAFAIGGCEVLLVMGGAGMPELDVGTARVVRLPAVRAAEGGFTTLVHPNGEPFDEVAKARRSALLQEHFDRFAPDVLIIEAFPFGRSQMAFELLPLLERARKRAGPPLVAASVRDILQGNRRPERIAETLDRIDRFFDLVLVHGDPRLVRLEDSFPKATRFGGKIAYTGLVAPAPAAAGADPEGMRYAVVVSAGGGAVGAPLIEAALRARPMTKLADRPWLVLTGPNLPDDEIERLTGLAGPGVTLQAFVPDLAQHLRGADLSVSQAGYNTVSDVLVAGCRAVLVPYAIGGEQEQTTRARLLQRMGLSVCLKEERLTPEALAAAMDGALDQARPARASLDLDGARATFEIVADRLSGRADASPPGARGLRR